MKKFLFALAVICLSSSVMKAQDWAQFGKYATANDTVKVKPVAVFMGDSITEGWYRTDPDFFTDNNFLGRGISGQTSSQMLVRFRRDVIDLHPKYVVILAGTNDIARNNGEIALKNILGNIISMCELAKANKIKPVLCSVLPCTQFTWRKEVTDAAEQIVALNKMLKEYAESSKITYVDYHSAMKNEEGGLPRSIARDGVHPNIDGFKIMEPMILGSVGQISVRDLYPVDAEPSAVIL